MDCRRYYDQIPANEDIGVHKIRFEQTLPSILKDTTLLDVGCGGGHWLNFLYEKKEFILFGMDVSPIRLDFAKRNLNGRPVSLFIGDIRHIPHHDNSFEQTTALEVLEHIPNWEQGLTELVRVASKRVIVTVPYNEKLKYEICPNCREEAYLFGHLHRFREDSFKNLNINGSITFEKLPPAFGLDYYVNRALISVLRRAKKVIEGNQENGHPLTTICSNCYEEVSYTKYFERTTKRLLKIVTHSPEYLLIKIDKQS